MPNNDNWVGFESVFDEESRMGKTEDAFTPMGLRLLKFL